MCEFSQVICMQEDTYAEQYGFFPFSPPPQVSQDVSQPFVGFF